MEPIIPRRKKVKNVYQDIHKLMTEPSMQRKKRDQSSSPIKYNDEPDFQSKRKFENIYKNKTTNETPQFYRKSHENDNYLINEIQSNLDAWPTRLRKSNSAHNIGRSRRHNNKKNIVNMPPAGCATNIPNFGEYVLLDSKVPYRLKSSNFPMNNSAIQDLYRPAFANNSDYIVLKNNVPYHLKKHSQLIGKNSETGDWWINNNDSTEPAFLNKPVKESYSLNSFERQRKAEVVPKYTRSRSQGDYNHQRKLYKDENQRTNQDPNGTANNLMVSYSKNHSTQTENINQHNNGNKLVNNLDKNLKAPPRVNIAETTANNKSPESKNINSNNTKIIKDKNIMVTKSDIANFVSQKHDEKKKRIKNPEIQPISENRNEKANHISNTNLNEGKKNIPLKIHQQNNDNKMNLKKNYIYLNSNLNNDGKLAKTGNNLNEKPNTFINNQKIMADASSRLGNPQRLSEYQRNFQWLSNYNATPIVKAHNYLHASHPNLSQFGKVVENSKDPQRLQLLKSEDKDLKTRRSQSAGPARHNKSDRSYLSRSEYANNFNEPSQYNYSDGLWNKKPLVATSARQKKEKSTDCDSALIPLPCVHG